MPNKMIKVDDGNGKFHYEMPKAEETKRGGGGVKGKRDFNLFAVKHTKVDEIIAVIGVKVPEPSNQVKDKEQYAIDQKALIAEQFITDAIDAYIAVLKNPAPAPAPAPKTPAKGK